MLAAKHRSYMSCLAYHLDTVRDVNAKRVQCDEIWSFVATKRNVKTMKASIDPIPRAVPC